jgi:hypothetical protein
MKQTDIKHCALCGQGVMHDNQLMFWRVRMQHLCVNLPAIERQHGLEMMLGGSAAIAHAMGLQEDLALPVGEELDILICQECSVLKIFVLGLIPEMVREKNEDEAQT